jgi:hypothetical protein
VVAKHHAVDVNDHQFHLVEAPAQQGV